MSVHFPMKSEKVWFKGDLPIIHSTFSDKRTFLQRQYRLQRHLRPFGPCVVVSGFDCIIIIIIICSANSMHHYFFTKSFFHFTNLNYNSVKAFSLCGRSIKTIAIFLLLNHFKLNRSYILLQLIMKKKKQLKNSMHWLLFIRFFFMKQHWSFYSVQLLSFHLL